MQHCLLSASPVNLERYAMIQKNLFTCSIAKGNKNKNGKFYTLTRSVVKI
jgi:hypothetical protein